MATTPRRRNEEDDTHDSNAESVVEPAESSGEILIRRKRTPDSKCVSKTRSRSEFSFEMGAPGW